MRALKSRNIDFHRAYSESLIVKKAQTPLRRALIFPCIIVALCAVFFGATFFIRQSGIKKTVPVVSYIDNSETKAQYEIAQKISSERDKFIMKNNGVNEIETALNKLPNMSDKLLSAVIEYAGNDVQINALNYDAQTGILQVTAICTTPEQGTIFAENMRKNNIFEGMSYHGYEVQAEGIYEMTVTAFVKTAEVAK